MLVDLTEDPVGTNKEGKSVFLRDIWPSNKLIRDTMKNCLSPDMFRTQYAKAYQGDDLWQAIQIPEGETYSWPESSYVRHPPYFADMTMTPEPVQTIRDGRILGLLGDSVTTDHISPAGAIPVDGPAGEYLKNLGVKPTDFNSFGARRGNHEVMVRGTFANIRLRNEMAPGTEGGWTKIMPEGIQTSIYDAAVHYAKMNTPLIIFAGKEYGTGSSRDWAAKGTQLLGVRAVIAESFERIHRSNLVGMGVLPLQFKEGMNRNTLTLKGDETFNITGISDGITPLMDVSLTISYADSSDHLITVTCRIDTLDEAEYYQHGGILQYVLRKIIKTH